MEKDALSLQNRSPTINSPCHVFAGQRLLRTELLSSVLTILVAESVPVSGIARARVGLSQKKVMETEEQLSLSRGTNRVPSPQKASLREQCCVTNRNQNKKNDRNPFCLK